MMDAATIEQARAAKRLAAEPARRHASVVGVGLTRLGASFGIKVNLGTTPTDPDQLPREIAGVPILYEVVGRFRPSVAD